MRDKLAYLIIMQNFTIFLSQTQLKVVSITYLYLHKFESKTTSNNVSMSHSHHSHVWCSYLFKLNLLTFSIDRDKLRIICIYDVLQNCVFFFSINKWSKWKQISHKKYRDKYSSNELAAFRVPKVQKFHKIL